MKNFVNVMKAFWNDEKGLEVVEYVIIGTLVVIVTISGYQALGNRAANKVNALSTSF
jgi:Flp pilus assembly pilin Flp